MPLPGPYDLEIYGGGSLDRTFALFQDEAETIPVNLTGYRAIAQIRSSYYPAGTLYATFGTNSPYSGITIPTPANGEIVLGTIDRTLLDACPQDRTLVWDLFIYVVGGVELPVLAGNCIVHKYVTRVP